jgi:hypothetical protein
MSHIAKHRIGINNYNIQVMKDAIDIAKRTGNETIGQYRINRKEDRIVIDGRGLYRPITIFSNGEITYDDMNRNRMEAVVETLNQYYVATATLIALKRMGYNTRMNITSEGEIQILGEEA